MSIFDLTAVLRRDVTIVHLDGKRFPARPVEQFFLCVRVWQDAENFWSRPAFPGCEQLLEILEAGEALDVPAAECPPEQNHEAAVRNCDLGPEHGNSGQ